MPTFTRVKWAHVELDRGVPVVQVLAVVTAGGVLVAAVTWLTDHAAVVEAVMWGLAALGAGSAAVLFGMLARNLRGVPAKAPVRLEVPRQLASPVVTRLAIAPPKPVIRVIVDDVPAAVRKDGEA